MKHVTLKQMLNELTKCILNNKEQPSYFWKRENEYILITQVDLMSGRFKTIDDDFSEYEWELKNSNIYKEI